MTTLMLYVGIAVTFLTVWGVVMTGSYLLGDETVDSPSVRRARRLPDASSDAEHARTG